jgi:hypothetical protein
VGILAIVLSAGAQSLLTAVVGGDIPGAVLLACGIYTVTKILLTAVKVGEAPLVIPESHQSDTQTALELPGPSGQEAATVLVPEKSSPSSCLSASEQASAPCCAIADWDVARLKAALERLPSGRRRQADLCTTVGCSESALYRHINRCLGLTWQRVRTYRASPETTPEDA